MTTDANLNPVEARLPLRFNGLEPVEFIKRAYGLGADLSGPGRFDDGTGSRPTQQSTSGKKDCPECNGSGVEEDYEVVPECCGNTTTSGDCRGDCAVPKEVPSDRPCQACGGTGKKRGGQ
jgi:hypothetical protein